ncbi:hypothetical protein N7491_010909 [Penicillium cf. griseofulvum]|nr:hypothetical protein N7491_010909 [Penicillium cf. griseofulvum]
MRLEPISDISKQVVDTIRELIAKGIAIHSNKTIASWRYEGDEFLKYVKSMQTHFQPKGSKVSGWLHRAPFLPRGEYTEPGLSYETTFNYPNKWNPNSLSPGEQIPPDNCCYIENTPKLSGEEIDVVFVAFEVDKQE